MLIHHKTIKPWYRFTNNERITMFKNTNLYAHSIYNIEQCVCIETKRTNCPCSQENNAQKYRRYEEILLLLMIITAITTIIKATEKKETKKKKNDSDNKTKM